MSWNISEAGSAWAATGTGLTGAAIIYSRPRKIQASNPSENRRFMADTISRSTVQTKVDGGDFKSDQGDEEEIKEL
jgi:hypothetical protein